MKRNSEPTWMTVIFILCATSFFSLYKYRKDKHTITYDIPIFQIPFSKIKKSQQCMVYVVLYKNVSFPLKAVTSVFLII